MPNKHIIFDATVLSNFLIAGATLLIKQRYLHRGVISWQVYDEISAGFRKEPTLRRIDSLLSQKSFKLITLSTKEHSFYVSLLDSLGRGEASCIAHARYSHYVVASDDKAARRICERYKIAYTGTIGILIAAYRDNQITIDKADEFLQAMIHAGFYSPVTRISDIV